MPPLQINFSPSARMEKRSRTRRSRLQPSPGIQVAMCTVVKDMQPAEQRPAAGACPRRAGARPA